MKELSYRDFIAELSSSDKRRPLFGQLELTWRCPFDCIHCYCGSDRPPQEGAAFWKDVIDQVHGLGGLELTFTGGDPLCHESFPDIYRHAVRKGFMVNVFTTGLGLEGGMMELFEAYPPSSIEITLNSLDKTGHARITRRGGALEEVMRNVRSLAGRGFPLVLKCNGLKENREEVLEIKRFSERLLGKGRFKFDSFIFPGLCREREPLAHRLDPEEILAIEREDPEMFLQRKKQLDREGRWFNPDGLYHCNSWFTRYFIDPQGILQFCHLTRDHSTDLKTHAFKYGFDRFLRVLDEKYTSESKCIDCELKESCYKCPARAYLETGDRESPVDYYCRLAEARAEFRKELGE